MAIRMQGTWLVSVKTKNASFPHEFVISGATEGNGTYPGTYAGEITVNDAPGSSWSISIRHNPGTGFQYSQHKLKFPTIVDGFHQFEIQSNDSGSDADFDDLVLLCRTPVSANDYLIYGHVADYEGPCLFNPCFYPFWVVDTPAKLAELRRIPKFREYIKKIHPELFVRPPFPPDPIGPVSLSPHPLPPKDFTPVVIPGPGELATPLKQRFLVRTEIKQLAIGGGGSKKAAAAPGTYMYNALKSFVPYEKQSLAIDTGALKLRAELESIIARFRCDSDPQANIRLVFQEYDRTAAEKSGGAYTGEGARRTLGSTFTDDFGNYIFRFTTIPDDITDEVVNDIAPGEDAFVIDAPDVIVRVMQPLNPFLLAFETAPYWNIPNRRRINVCVPREKIGIRPMPCNGQHIFQGVGNIPLGEAVGGVRDNYGNYLDANGVITSTNSLGPRTSCAAWTGTLYLNGCLSNPDVKYYTLEHREPGEDWQPLAHEFTLPRNNLFSPNGQIFQGMDGGRAIYLNAETDGGSDWLTRYKGIKGQVPSRMFISNGPRQIRITGLDAGRNPIAGIQETLTLFILNNGIDLDIREDVSMAGLTVSDCGLFTLPAGDPDAALRVRFKANQVFAPPVYGSFGFMGGYALSMDKGSTGNFPVSAATGSLPLSKSYVPAPGGGSSCDFSFGGTRDELSSVNGYIEVDVQPVDSDGWLEPTQTFCAFALKLNGHLRHTDGFNANWDAWATQVLLGIQR